MKLHTEVVITRGKERVRYFIDGVRCTKEQYERAGQTPVPPSIGAFTTILCNIQACDRDWNRLVKTSIEGVRHCVSCKKNVHLCKTQEEADFLALHGMCGALRIGPSQLMGTFLPRA